MLLPLADAASMNPICSPSNSAVRLSVAPVCFSPANGASAVKWRFACRSSKCGAC